MTESQRKHAYYKRSNKCIRKSSLLQLLSFCYVFYVSNNFYSYVFFFPQTFCVAILFAFKFFRIANVSQIAKCDMLIRTLKYDVDTHTSHICTVMKLEFL